MGGLLPRGAGLRRPARLRPLAVARACARALLAAALPARRRLAGDPAAAYPGERIRFAASSAPTWPASGSTRSPRLGPATSSSSTSIKHRMPGASYATLAPTLRRRDAARHRSSAGASSSGRSRSASSRPTRSTRACRRSTGVLRPLRAETVIGLGILAAALVVAADRLLEHGGSLARADRPRLRDPRRPPRRFFGGVLVPQGALLGAPYRLDLLLPRCLPGRPPTSTTRCSRLSSTRSRRSSRRRPAVPAPSRD